MILKKDDPDVKVLERFSDGNILMIIIDMPSKQLHLYKDAKFIDHVDFTDNEMTFEIIFQHSKDVIQILNETTFTPTKIYIEAFKYIDQKYFLDYYHEKISKFIQENIKNEFDISDFYKYIKKFKN